MSKLARRSDPFSTLCRATSHASALTTMSELLASQSSHPTLEAVPSN